MGISLSQAIEGFLLEQDARRLSPHTISDYALTLRRFRAHLPQDPPFDQTWRRPILTRRIGKPARSQVGAWGDKSHTT